MTKINDTVKAAFALLCTAAATLEDAANKVKETGKTLILEAALAGMDRDAIRAMFEASWTANGHTGERAAASAKDPAGMAWNKVRQQLKSCKLDAAGVPVVVEDPKNPGKWSLVTLGKDGEKPAARMTPAEKQNDEKAREAAKEAAAIDEAWRDLIDALSPSQFDKLRAKLVAVGMPERYNQKKAA